MRSEKTSVIDATDKAILAMLQNNADTPVAEIAEQVGLTVTPCWRRIQKLEEKGIISKRVALLQAKQLGPCNDGFRSSESRKARWKMACKFR